MLFLTSSCLSRCQIIVVWCPLIRRGWPEAGRCFTQVLGPLAPGPESIGVSLLGSFPWPVTGSMPQGGHGSESVGKIAWGHQQELGLGWWGLGDGGWASRGLSVPQFSVLTSC